MKEGSRRLTRFLEELATVESGATTSWQFGEDEWSCLVPRHIAEKRSGLAARKDIVDGLMIAIERIDDINTVVQSASDRPAAVALLTQAPFSFVSRSA